MKATDERPGRYGPYGGQYVPETLVPALEELERAWGEARQDEGFQAELDDLLARYSGRPTPLTFCPRLTERLGGARIFLKREDLNHTGAHKINNTLGQGLLARYMGKPRIVCETGAGQHGVATATICARLGLHCVVYMGRKDVERQRLNAFKIRLLGAELRPVESGTKTLKDAINAAIRDWIANVHDTHYLLGSVVGPHPYPAMVRELQAVIGEETLEQLPEDGEEVHLVACVGGGSNAMGLFHPFVGRDDVRMWGVEAAGHGLDAPGGHSATLSRGRPGVLHGAYSYVLQNGDGQIETAHSVAPGLDYSGVGPEHSWFKEMQTVTYATVDDAGALEAFELLSRLEGIIPALESAHAVAHAVRLAPTLPDDARIVVNLSGRGDKDLDIAMEELDARKEA